MSKQIAKGRYLFDMGTTGVERFQLHLLVPRQEAGELQGWQEQDLPLLLEPLPLRWASSDLTRDDPGDLAQPLGASSSAHSPVVAPSNRS